MVAKPSVWGLLVCPGPCARRVGDFVKEEAVCLHRLRNGRRARRHDFDLASPLSTCGRVGTP